MRLIPNNFHPLKTMRGDIGLPKPVAISEDWVEGIDNNHRDFIRNEVISKFQSDLIHFRDTLFEKALFYNGGDNYKESLDKYYYVVDLRNRKRLFMGDKLILDLEDPEVIVNENKIYSKQRYRIFYRQYPDLGIITAKR